MDAKDAMKPKSVFRALVRVALLLAAAGVTLACAWLTYSEYRFARGTSDLRVMWWSLVVGVVFVLAAVGGAVGLVRLIAGLSRKGSSSGWEGLSAGGLAGMCALGAAAVACCYLAVGADAANRHTQLGGVEPGKRTVLWVDRGGNVVDVEPGHRGSAPTGLGAYWFPALTGVVSALFTWAVGDLVRRH